MTKEEIEHPAYFSYLKDVLKQAEKYFEENYETCESFGFGEAEIKITFGNGVTFSYKEEPKIMEKALETKKLIGL